MGLTDFAGQHTQECLSGVIEAILLRSLAGQVKRENERFVLARVHLLFLFIVSCATVVPRRTFAAICAIMSAGWLRNSEVRSGLVRDEQDLAAYAGRFVFDTCRRVSNDPIGAIVFVGRTGRSRTHVRLDA
jgi:hypothetical protein